MSIVSDRITGNDERIELDRLSLAQLENGGHTSSNRIDTTRETLARLRAGISEMEKAKAILTSLPFQA